VANVSVPKKERSAVRRRMHLALKEAEERFAHELMDEERLVLHDRIIRLKMKLASLAAS
jgi:hypothetical protein